ncbi:fibroleukin-like [Drosophila grimshawi]|uniref:fibroleukin-like n=1 Tax=Drosophila grimshawi TaxID=7222 RepID=UPI000C86ED3D|nr:fibroleukin-like [Drosophila grimshawi]
MLDLFKSTSVQQSSVINEMSNKLKTYTTSQKSPQSCARDVISKQHQIDSDAIKLKELNYQLEEHNKIIEQKDQQISNLQNTLQRQIDSDAIKLQEYNMQLEEHKKTISHQNQQLYKLQNNVIKSDVKWENLSEITKIDCSAFGDVAGVHKISFSNYTFDVLCDSETAGPGWTVIQQRIRGNENFHRNWTTYREGFGSFDGDFFLGLDKVHRLTSSKPYELYIHLEHFNGQTEYARYQQFEIAAERDEYQLSINGFSGDSRDTMSYFNNHQKFTTYDRDNDNWINGNCALQYYGGWWYNNACIWHNLNAKYYKSYHNWRDDGLYWNGAVKSAKMLIRPAII